MEDDLYLYAHEFLQRQILTSEYEGVSFRYWLRSARNTEWNTTYTLRENTEASLLHIHDLLRWHPERELK